MVRVKQPARKSTSARPPSPRYEAWKAASRRGCFCVHDCCAGSCGCARDCFCKRGPEPCGCGHWARLGGETGFHSCTRMCPCHRLKRYAESEEDSETDGSNAEAETATCHACMESAENAEGTYRGCPCAFQGCECVCCLVYRQGMDCGCRCGGSQHRACHAVFAARAESSFP